MVIWTSDLVVRIGTWCFVFEDYHAVKETYMLPFFSLIVFFSIEIICVFDFFTSFKYIYGSLWIKLENWDELLNKKNKNVVVVFSVQIDTSLFFSLHEPIRVLFGLLFPLYCICVEWNSTVFRVNPKTRNSRKIV